MMPVTTSTRLPRDERINEYRRRLRAALGQTAGSAHMLLDIGSDFYLLLLELGVAPVIYSDLGDDSVRKDRFAYCLFSYPELIEAYAARVIATHSAPPCTGTFTSVNDLSAHLLAIAPSVLSNLTKR